MSMTRTEKKVLRDFYHKVCRVPATHGYTAQVTKRGYHRTTPLRPGHRRKSVPKAKSLWEWLNRPLYGDLCFDDRCSTCQVIRALRDVRKVLGIPEPKFLRRKK